MTVTYDSECMWMLSTIITEWSLLKYLKHIISIHIYIDIYPYIYIYPWIQYLKSILHRYLWPTRREPSAGASSAWSLERCFAPGRWAAMQNLCWGTGHRADERTNLGKKLPAISGVSSYKIHLNSYKIWGKFATQTGDRVDIYKWWPFLMVLLWFNF